MRRRDLSLGILAAGSLVGARRIAAAEQAAALSRAERDAGVTPVDLSHPPGNVRRYGARGDGVSDDTAAFQAAINTARRANAGTVYAPSGAAATVCIPPPDVHYLLTKSLDCTFAGRDNQHGISLRCECAPSPDSPAIIARHRGHVFDLTGCDSAVFENLNIGTDEHINPQTCFLLARNRTGGSAGFHRFRNVRVHGKFSVTVLYNYGSESNVYSECIWFNESTAAATKVAVFSSHNVLHLKSDFIAIASGPQSSVDHQILGGSFCNTSTDAAADVLYLDAVDSLKIFGPWMAAGLRAPGGRALLYIDSSNGASSLGEVYALQGEGGATQQYGFYFADEGASTPSGWTLDGCLVPSSRYALYSGAKTTLDNFHISNLRERRAHGLCAMGVMQNSTVSSGTLPLLIGTSRRNTLIGDAARWNIVKRDADYWVDSGSARKTWNPEPRGLKISGALRVEGASCVFHGPLVTLSAMLRASVIQCAAGAELRGLPAAAVAPSAQVSICDGETGAALGGGMVTGATIVLPALPPRASIVVTASYFVA